MIMTIDTKIMSDGIEEMIANRGIITMAHYRTMHHGTPCFSIAGHPSLMPSGLCRDSGIFEDDDNEHFLRDHSRLIGSS